MASRAISPALMSSRWDKKLEQTFVIVVRVDWARFGTLFLSVGVKRKCGNVFHQLSNIHQVFVSYLCFGCFVCVFAVYSPSQPTVSSVSLA